jgi:hypothetical protein
MAKRRGTIAATKHKIEDFAEDLGKMLGQARNKAEGWLNQRETIVKNLTQLRDEANKLLAQLGHGAQSIVRRGRKPGRPAAVVVNKLRGAVEPVIRKRRKMSAAARAKISAAQKARWAKSKAVQK